jgi:hypothetical protein
MPKQITFRELARIKRQIDQHYPAEYDSLTEAQKKDILLARLDELLYHLKKLK